LAAVVPAEAGSEHYFFMPIRLHRDTQRKHRATQRNPQWISVMPLWNSL
jgi:hypothetical protein